MFVVHRAQLLSHMDRREAEGLEHPSYSRVYSFIVWSDFTRRKHMVVEERNCWEVNVSFEMPLLAS